MRFIQYIEVSAVELKCKYILIWGGDFIIPLQRLYIQFGQEFAMHLWIHLQPHKVYLYILNQYHQRNIAKVVGPSVCPSVCLKSI